MYRKQRKLMTLVVERAQSGKDKEIEMEKENRKKTDDKHVELFRRLKEEVEDRQLYKDPTLSRESLAELLGTNRTYITDAVKAMTGMTLPQYISRLRINEAERLMHDMTTDVSNLSQLSQSLGFASPSAFQTAFKRQTGMTLSAYRNIARKDKLSK